MILKIKREGTVEGWFIVDNIAELSYDWKLKKELHGCDRHFDCVEKSLDEDNENYVEMLVTFKDRREELMITQVTTFLLNDEGKTIEKIY